MAAAAILCFWNREILLVIRFQKVETHLQAKFCQNRLIGWEDIKIFRFFKMAAAAILDFQICEILLADAVWRAQTYNCAKFRHNWSFHCGDIAIFRIFKMAAATILDFRVHMVEAHLHAKLCQNQSIGCEDIKIFRFFKMAAVRHIGFVWSTIGPPTVSTCVSLSLCKFGYDRCSSYYNMNISIFDAFGWKMPIHAPKIGVLGNLIPKMWCNINESQKRHTLAWVRVIWAIKREYVVNGLTCRWVT